MLVTERVDNKIFHRKLNVTSIQIFYQQNDVASVQIQYYCTMEKDRMANQRSAFSLSFTLALYISIRFGLSKVLVPHGIISVQVQVC